MKERLVVLNGQKLVQTDAAGDWSTVKVEKAGTLKAGIYPIYLATAPDQTKTFDGVIVHADKDNVYQQIGKNFIKHDRAAFDILPNVGEVKSIGYQDSKAIATEQVQRRGIRI